MATCAQLKQEVDSELGSINSILAAGNTALTKGSAPFPKDYPAMQRLHSAVVSAEGNVITVVDYLNDVIDRGSKLGCTSEVARARELLQKFNNLRNSLSSLSSKTGQEEFKLLQQTRQSTESTDNAGTGKPGTAGQGAKIPAQEGRAGGQFPSNTTVDDPNATIPEITVTGTRPNNKLKVTDPNIPTTAGNIDITSPNFNFDDGLEEVTITGRPNRGNLVVNEPGMIGAGPVNVDAPNFNLEGDEELEEVTVTGRRVPTTTGAVQETRKQATLREETNFGLRNDWRVRLSLAPGASYLYKDTSNKLLEPLNATDGVLFPYTPQINVTYAANYQPTDPAHTNYKFYQYENSYVDNINIGCDFTAQDTTEARYLLAVIHFFKSATKMFYGQDQNPKPGTPPPMCFLYGFGEFQFNAHPLAITNFSYNLPNDVDYIRTGSPDQEMNDNLPTVPVTAKRIESSPKKSSLNAGKGWGQLAQEFVENRLGSGIAAVGNFFGLQLTAGGGTAQPNWAQGGFNAGKYAIENWVTYVPTKINLQISCIPLMSRYEVSNRFSLKDYANGNLVRGNGAQGGRKSAGFW